MAQLEERSPPTQKVRWFQFDNLLNIWTFTTMKFCQKALKIVKVDTKLCPILSIPPRNWLARAFNILPKCRNFAKSGHGGWFEPSHWQTVNFCETTKI